jgi:hypothetical protein
MFRSMLASVALSLFSICALTSYSQSQDSLVTVGSPATMFPQNHQEEPALAVDANHPNILVAGANDAFDLEACAAGDPTVCDFTPGVGLSGVYFSFDSGKTWTQPTYTGLTGRDCLGPAPCTPHVGPIGTVPRYFESGLMSAGDPGVAFGPRPGPDGTFSWSNGSRLYYSNLASRLTRTAFRGVVAATVSRTDNVQAAAAGDNSAWMPPVIVGRRNAALFSDKDQIWADNAASSPFFGNVYLCDVAFRGAFSQSQHAFANPLTVSISRDGGDTWQEKQITPAAGNINHLGFSGCSVRTDSHGVVYVFAQEFALGLPGFGFHILVQSSDGGHTWTRPRRTVQAVDICFVVDPVQGRCVSDGIAGARNDLSASPSVDIANGAPTGVGATDEIIDTWVDGRAGLNHEHVLLSMSMNRGVTWSSPENITQAGDRGFYSAGAISPTGTDIYVAYDAFPTPFRTNTTDPRGLVGVVVHSSVGAGGSPVVFSQLHRGVVGDPRASSHPEFAIEFLGDYIYAVATRTYGAAVWTDVRHAAVCPAVNAYRESLETGGSVPRPAPNSDCPATFGNSDIFAGSFANP